MRPVVSFVALILIAAVIDPCRAALAAQLDDKAVVIAAKTFNFLIRKFPPDARMLVIGGAADPAAVRSAFARMAVSAGRPADAANAAAVIVSSNEEALAARAANAGVLTIGADPACVEAGACLMAIETQPTVTIYVSRAAARAAGIEFEPNFKMLVTEK